MEPAQEGKRHLTLRTPPQSSKVLSHQYSKKKTVSKRDEAEDYYQITYGLNND